jgi:hypothetical protein
MAERKNETISSVSDILGFILDQSKKPPDKRKPVKLETGDIQAESEYIGAVVDALAAPGVFVGEQILGTVEDLVNAEAEFKIQGTRLPKVKVKVSDVPNLVRDPGKFIDSLFEKNREISKMQRLQWAGESMRMLVGSTYARDIGLFEEYDKETKAVLERAVGQAAKAGNESDFAWMIDASHRLMQKGEVGKKINRINSQLQTTQNNYVKDSLRNEKERIEEIYKSATAAPSSSSLLGFRNLLKEEFEAKEESLLGGREEEQLSENEEREFNKMEIAKSMTNLWGAYDNKPVTQKKFIQQKKKLEARKQELLDQQKRIKSGEISFSTRSEKRRALESIKSDLRIVNKSEQNLSQIKFWSKLGQLEGSYYGIKNTLG